MSDKNRVVKTIMDAATHWLSRRHWLDRKKGCKGKFHFGSQQQCDELREVHRRHPR